MRTRFPGLLAAAVVAACALAQAAAELVVCDLDEVQASWRSKFDGHEIVRVEREGQTTRAVRLRFDLSRAPHYDWFRCYLDEPVDVRPYKYVSLWVKGDGSGARMIPMLMQPVAKSAEYPHGEIVTSARQHWIDLSFEGWRQLSVPLAAFDRVERIAEGVQVVNFSLDQRSPERRPGEVIVDDIKLVQAAPGDVVEETVPSPPADIAIRDEREFFEKYNIVLVQYSNSDGTHSQLRRMLMTADRFVVPRHRRRERADT
ncbi:MAG: hypothetical protein ACE5JM_18230, partial [Armatimonadota bacterium]